jgi:hypothetical protein
MYSQINKIASPTDFLVFLAAAANTAAVGREQTRGQILSTRLSSCSVGQRAAGRRTVAPGGESIRLADGSWPAMDRSFDIAVNGRPLGDGVSSKPSAPKTIYPRR